MENLLQIKLFVCCHKPEQEVPKHPLLVPIQVGASLAESHFPDFYYDDNGRNISSKNRSYCELTAQYWAWKNIDADYYGFFHYRRYVYPHAQAKLPYILSHQLSTATLKKRGYDCFSTMIGQYDCIIPIGEDMCVSVREHYANAPFHHQNDLQIVEEIIEEQYPEYIPSMSAYLSQTLHYFGNIFIMKKDVFHHYAQWLFTILEEFDKRADTSHYSSQELRVDGYLGERLLGIYVTWLRQSGQYSILELPRLHYIPERKLYWKAKLCNFLLPPGSRRRAIVKRMGGKRNG